MPQDLVEVDEYPEIITIPEPGEDRKILSLKPAFSKIANRTKYLETRRGDAARVMPGVELAYVNAARVVERRARHDFLPLTDFSTRDDQFYMGDFGILACGHPAGATNPQIEVSHQLRLPRGSRLDSVATCIEGGVGVTWKLMVRPVVFNPLGASELGAETIDALTYGTLAPASLSASGLGIEFDANVMRVQIVLRANKTGPAAANLMGKVHCVHVYWLEAGPIGNN